MHCIYLTITINPLLFFASACNTCARGGVLVIVGEHPQRRPLVGTKPGRRNRWRPPPQQYDIVATRRHPCLVLHCEWYMAIAYVIVDMVSRRYACAILMFFMSTKAQKSTSRWHMLLYCRQLRFHLPRTSRVQVSPSLQQYTSNTAPNQNSRLGVSVVSSRTCHSTCMPCLGGTTMR